MNWLINLFLLFILSSGSSAFADRTNIFDVRKNLKLSDSEPAYKDYYINSGSDQGLKKGIVVNVVRRTPVHDSVKNQSQGDLLTVIAKVRIIHAQKTISVGRLFEETSDKNRPVAEFRTIMVGDELDLDSMMVPVKPKKKKRKKRKVSSTTPAAVPLPNIDSIIKKAEKLAPTPVPVKKRTELMTMPPKPPKPLKVEPPKSITSTRSADQPSNLENTGALL